MAEHLHDGACHCCGVKHQDGEEHESAVAHRRVCVDILEVGLHTCAECTVDHRDTCQDEEYPGEFGSSLGHQIDGHAEAAVAAKFHKHAGMEHGHRGGC